MRKLYKSRCQHLVKWLVVQLDVVPSDINKRTTHRFSYYHFIHWVTLSFRNTKVLPEVLHQTLNPTAELWCKTLSRIKVNLVLHRT